MNEKQIVNALIPDEKARIYFDNHNEEYSKQYDEYIKTHGKGECLGYTGKPCTQCGRVRVEAYENGDKVCEKCHWNETTKEYEDSRY